MSDPIAQFLAEWVTHVVQMLALAACLGAVGALAAIGGRRA